MIDSVASQFLQPSIISNFPKTRAKSRYCVTYTTKIIQQQIPQEGC